MKTATSLLVLLIFSGVCNSALAGSVLTAHAQSIIAEVDRTEKMVKPLLQSKPPAGASARLRSAWQNMVRKAEKVCACCKPVRLYAQKIVNGDESEETIDMLGKMLHKLRLAVNEFEEAMEELQHVRRDEA